MLPFLSALAGERVTNQGRALGRRSRRVPQLPVRSWGDGGGGGPWAVLGPSGCAGVSLSIGTKAELEALRPAAGLRDQLGRVRAMNFLAVLLG